MNKNILILIGGIVVVAAVGGFLFLRGNNSSTGSPNNPVENLQASLTGSGSMKCEYTDETGQQVVTYIKDGKIRSDYSGGEGNGSVIVQKEGMWSWENETKQGMYMAFSDVDEIADSQDADFDNSSVENKKEIEEQVEKYKDSCKNERISDDLFNPPTDVTFQNMSDFMNAVPQLPNQF